MCLTAREVSLRQLRGGAVAGGVLYTVLQSLGAFYVGHVLYRATNTPHGPRPRPH